jgi:glutamate/tyrosine decarboxylase-like PLP-dependent enzyme
MLAVSVDCRPANFSLLVNSDDASLSGAMSLAEKAKLAQMKALFLGFPLNMSPPSPGFLAWRRQVRKAGIDEFTYNNVGNPYKDSVIPYNTHEFEREISAKFGAMYGFPQGKTWGFLTNSGTDSNMHGMYMGRTLLKGRTGVVPKCYFTKEAHYSIQVLRDVLGIDFSFVDTLPDGGMNPEDLQHKLAKNPDQPALVVATVGTTFKGAIDPIDRIQEVLKGYPSYLHLDAALFGGYLPHIAHADEILHQTSGRTGAKRYDSIAVSCHKFFGFPAPAGLFIMTRSSFEEFNEIYGRVHSPEYIGHVPGTITCSRDAVKPADFYYFTTADSLLGQAEDARRILQSATNLYDQMRTQLPYAAPNRASALSNTIYFKKPSDWIVKKYSLATMKLPVNQKMEDFAHVVIMPHVTDKVLAEFLTDMDQDMGARL